MRRQFYAAMTALGAARRRNPLPTSPGKALELWLTIRIADHCRLKGAVVELRDGAGSPLKPGVSFVTRGRPDVIAAASASKPGYISIRMNGVPGSPPVDLELHGGLQFEGRSRALHEIDISVLPECVGSAIRRSGPGAPIGIPYVAIECKMHKRSGPVGEAREKLARLFDLTRIPICEPRNAHQVFWPMSSRARGGGRRHRPYKEQFADGFYAIVRSSGFDPGAQRVIDHYRLHRRPDVTIGTNADDLCGEVFDQLSKY